MTSNIFNACIHEAKQLGDNLFPIDCIQILENNYKGRMDVMNPKTIVEKVISLMETLVDRESIDIDIVHSVVENWVGLI